MMRNASQMIRNVVCLLLALLLTFQGVVLPSGETVGDPAPVQPALSYAIAEEPADPPADPPAGTGPTNDLDGSKIEGIKLVWVTPDSRTNNDGQAVSQAELDDTAHLYLATTSSSPQSMIYKVEVEFSGQYDYAAGDITITIPAQVWHGRQFVPTGEGDETVGVVDESKLIGTLELPLPAAPSKKADFNWQIIDGNYVLTNTRTIGATSSVTIEVAIRNVYPGSVVDMSETIPITAHCEVVTNQGNTIELTSTPITAQLDTCAKITSAYKNGEVFEEKPALSDELLARLPEGADPDDYLYVRWYTYHSHVNNQPFSLDMTDNLSYAFEYETDANGNQIKDEDGKPIRKFVTDGIFLGSTNYEGEIVDEENLDFSAHIADHDTSSTTGTQYSHTVYMWSAYKKDDFYVPRANEMPRVYYFENEVDWYLTESDAAVDEDEWGKPADPQKVTQAHDDVQLRYAPVRWSRPDGHFAVNKWTEQIGSKDWLYGYALNKLEDEKPITMNFVVETIGYGYPWTSPLTNGYTYDELAGMIENGELDNLDLTEEFFGVLGWKQVTDDFQQFFNFETVPLTSEDFEFDALRISKPSKMRYSKNANGTWSYKSDSSLPTPDLIIEYQLDNEDTWYHAATATWGEDGLGQFQFVDVSDQVTTSGMTVYFPDNVTDTRHTFTSNVFGGQVAERCEIAQLDWYVYPVITLKPTERVRQIVAELFEESENPTTKFRNDVVMDVYGWVDENGEGTLVLDDDFDTSLATYAGASYGVSLNKSGSFQNDIENQRMLIHYTATLTEQSNLKQREDYDESVAEGVIVAETSGVWYDLLPPHVVPLLDTIRLRDGDTITNIYTIENYKDTGRTLLVVEAELTPKPSLSNGLGYSDRPTLRFTGAYTWLDMDEYGKNLVNYVAFESTVEDLRNGTIGTIDNQKGEPDNPLGGNNATTPSMPADILAAMTGLNPNTVPGENRFVYGKCSNNVSALTYAVSGLDKAVSNDLVGIWTQGLEDQEQVTVYEGHGYSYRLRVSSAETTSTKGIVLYDTLENYIIPDPSADEDTDATKAADFAHTEERKDWEGDWQGKGQWRGTLVKVDVSEFLRNGCAPVVLYSQLPGLQFADSKSESSDENFDEDTELFSTGNYDISDRQIWQVAEIDENGIWTVPEGLYVSAIAIDATTTQDGQEFVLRPEESLSAYLRMRAPDDNSDPDVWNAKGAYARVTDADGNYVLDENGHQQIDWEAAMDKENNMYAYNNARVRLIQGQTNASGTNWISGYRMIRNDYTRVGILPGVITLEKIWQDQNNHDGLRPETVTVAVMRRVAGMAGGPQPVLDHEGQPIVGVLDAESGWKKDFYQLDVVNELGLRYLYSFVEEPVEGYESKVQFIDTNHYKMTNKHPNVQIPISGQKVWNDDDNAYGVRPERITLKLYRDDQLISTKTVTAGSDGSWSYSFGNMDKYADGGHEYVYRVEEEYVPKYADETEGYQLVNNTYHPYGHLEVTKTLAEATAKASEKEFTFTLVLLQEQTDPDEPAVPVMDKFAYAILEEQEGEWVELSTGEIGNGDTFTLKGGQKLMVYDLPSECTYQVTESETAGFTVTAVDDEGTIQAGETACAQFTNTYKAGGNTQLKLNKSLSGRQIRKNQFRFELVDNNPDSETYGEVIRTARVNAPEEGDTTGGVGTDIASVAEAIFGQLDYTHADDGKTFHYIVREVDMGADGYGYDVTEYEVTVTVSDDNGDGTLTVTHNFMETAMSFANTYEAEGQVVLEARKLLNGRELQAGEFTFELYPFDKETNTITGECLGTATNDADGKIVFAALHFDQNDVSLDDADPATYVYLLKEKKGTDKTVEYSNQEFIITVKVYDNGDGTLSFVQDQQTGVRTQVECPDCEGEPAGVVIQGATSDGYYQSYLNEYNSSWSSTSLNKHLPTFCDRCLGLAYVGGSLCLDCKGSGFKLGATLYFPGTGNVYDQEAFVYKPGSSSERAFMAIDCRTDDQYYYIQTNLSKISGTAQCSTCNGTGKVEGPLEVSGEVTFPVFENELKPGNLKITKKIYGSGSSNPNQRFTFHVRFSGRIPNELGNLASTVPVQTAKTPFAATNLSGSAYAVLNQATGAMDFFRASTNANGGVTYNGSASGNTEINFPSSSSSAYTVTVNGTSYTLFRYFESISSASSLGSWPWHDYASSIRTITMSGDIKPGSCAYMFSGCTNLTSADFSRMDTSKVTSMRDLFNGCTKLASVNVPFNTSNVTVIWNMFKNCSSLVTLDLSSFNTAKVTDMDSVFNGCSSLTTLDISNFDTRNLRYWSNHFYGCSKISTIKLGNYSRFTGTYPSASSASPYIGKWMCLETGEALTSASLFPNSGHPGTWVWAKQGFTLKFDANGGHGTMNAQHVPLNTAHTIVPTFYRFGYDLVGFTDGTTTYPCTGGTVTIPANNGYTNGQTVTLKAVWEEWDPDETETISSFSFTLAANESITFEGIPANTVYEVWEETPAGWIFYGFNGNLIDTIQPLETSEVEAVNEYTPNSTYAVIRAGKLFDGQAPTNSDFQFELLDADGNVISTKGYDTARGVLFIIDYDLDDVGKTFTYYLREKPGNNYQIIYDPAVYTAEVTVTDHGNGELSADVVYKDAEGNVLTAPSVFENEYCPGGLRLVKGKNVPSGMNSNDARFADTDFLFEVTFSNPDGTPWKGSPEGYVKAKGWNYDEQGNYVSDTVYATYEITNGVVQVPINALNSNTVLYDIPKGTLYSVKEIGTYPGWTPEDYAYSNAEGVIVPYSHRDYPESTGTTCVLVNQYKHSGKAALEVVKNLIGRTPADGEFTFELIGADGNVIETVTNTSTRVLLNPGAPAGTEPRYGYVPLARFSEMTFNNIGTYTFTIREVIPADADPTIEYSSEVITATVKMEDLEGTGRLTPTITYTGGTGDNGNTITNELKPGSLQVSKTVVSSHAPHAEQNFTFSLNLADNQGQPISGSYTLEKGGVSEELTVSAGRATFTLKGGETALITGLPHGASYVVSEAVPGGFTVKQNGANGSIVVNQTANASFTNTYASKGSYTPVALKNLTGKTLESGEFTFVLQDEDGYKVAEARNNADGSITFEDLEFTHEDVGTKVYRIVEQDQGVAGYTYDDTVLTVTLTIEDNGDGTLSVTDDLEGQPALFSNTFSDKVSHSVSKVWADEEDALGLRPQSITVELYRNNVKVDEVQLTAENGWAYTFADLPAFDEQGVKYSYRVQEVPVPGYTTGLNAQGNVTTITNTVMGALEISKTVDEGDQEKEFLFTATFTRDGEPVSCTIHVEGPDGAATAELDENGVYTFWLSHGQTLRITGLPIGAAYVVAEVTGAAYEGQVTEGEAEGIILRGTLHQAGFTNTMKPTSFSVTKQWEGGSGPIELTLYANGVKLDPQPPCIRNGDVYTFSNLPMYDDLGNQITYSAKERYFDGFVTIYSNVAPFEGNDDFVYNGGTIINRKTREADFTVQKIWRGLNDGETRPAITLVLYCNGEALDVPTPQPTSGGWYKYYDLPDTYKGQPAVYTVVEATLPGFDTAYENAAGEETECAENGGTIINTRIPPTSDCEPVGLWSGLMLMAVCAMAFLMLMRRRKA